MQNRLLIVEGADKVGKSHFINRLFLRNSKKVSLIENNSEFFILNVNEKRKLIDTLKELPNDKIYVLDRFILTDLVYDEVLARFTDLYAFEELLYELCEEFDVRFLILDADQRVEDFKDDKIALTSEQYNAVVAKYRSFETHRALQGRLIFSKIVTNGSIDRMLESALLKQIEGTIL